MRNAFWICLVLTAQAQAQWIAVRDDAVRPPMIAAYAKAAASETGAPLTTVALSNLHYLTLAEVASLDAARSFGARWIDADATESRSVSIWRLRRDLSYEPAAPRLTPEEEGFLHFDVYAFLPGHEAETEALTKEYVAVDREAGVRHRWLVYEVVVGADVPAFVLATPARTRSDFESEKVAADALRKARDLPLHVRNTRLLRRVTSFEGTIVKKSASPPPAIGASSSAASRRTDSMPE